MSATTPTTIAMTVGRRRRSGRGASGRPCSTISPRVGRLEPRHHSAITMMTNVTSALTPGSAAPWSVGNQLCVEK